MLETDAARRLVLAPAWDRPETWIPALSQFAAFAPVDGSACLALEHGPGDVPLRLLFDLVAHVCTATCNLQPFGEVVIVDEPVDPVRDRAERVATAADVRAALGIPDASAAVLAGEIVGRATSAKRLVDQTTAALDRFRYESAPDPFVDPEPLVTVRIATWGSTDLLLTRALPSVLNGSYARIEVLVCSDGPDEQARAAVESVADPRVRYLALPARPSYPAHFQNFWFTAGSYAVNHALDAARGSFIAPHDHDDAFLLHHLRDLLAAARDAQSDMVFGQIVHEMRSGPWGIYGSPVPHVPHGAVLYSQRLAHMRYDPIAWVLGEAGDQNMWRRMREAGVAMTHVPEVVSVHWREKTMIEDDPRVDRSALAGNVQIPVDDMANDILSTDARWLLEVAFRPADAV